jgi:hypothetical protein
MAFDAMPPMDAKTAKIGQFFLSRVPKYIKRFGR